MTTSGPNGSELNTRLTRWALEHYLGLRDGTPEPLVVGDDALVTFAGRYETIAAICDVTVEQVRLVVASRAKASMIAALCEHDEVTRSPLAMIAGDRDPFIISEGPGQGRRGYFSRGADGAVDGMHIGGRLASRVEPVAVA